MDEPSVSGQDDFIAGIFTSEGGMVPDHPLLQRAQQALAKQLEAKKLRVEGELREKKNVLQKAKFRTEAVGVELYGFQQTLAKLQMSLEAAQENFQNINTVRRKAEEEVQRLQSQLQGQQSGTKQERQKYEIMQRELDRLGATLLQIEAYNESMKSEIAVTRRAAYAAEEAVQELEKEKISQDYLISDLQDNIKSLHEQSALYTAQLQSQMRETRAAQETLAEAEAEMEVVHFEKKQLLAQWKSCLTAIQRRDEALAAIEDCIRQQQEQELAIATETRGYKKDIIKEQIQNEKLTGVVNKMAGERELVLRQIQGFLEKQEKAATQLDQLSGILEQTEEKIKSVDAEAKAVNQEQDSLERAIGKAFKEIRALETDMLHTLSEQTTAEKSTFKTTRDIEEVQQQALQEELRIAQTQNELAKLQVDILNTDSHNQRLLEAKKLLDAELTDKEGAIAKYELEMKRRADEIERKTRDIDQLNRKIEKVTASRPEAIQTGPLESTIVSLSKEIEKKGVEGKELQRRWITKQTELVALQLENNHVTETLARRKAEATVLRQKLNRLEQQLNHQASETKALGLASGRLHVDLQRINGLIAQNDNLRTLLREENLQLEGRALSELRELEEEAARLSSAIEEHSMAKKDLLADVVEAERQIMLLERKMQLEKEMQEMLDSTVGEGVVSTMRKEVHRMELRQGELQRQQEKLVQELEKALSKYEIIGVKAQGQQSTKAKPGTSGTGTADRGHQRMEGELQKQLKDAEKEAAALEVRIAQLQAEWEALQQRRITKDQDVKDLLQQHELLRHQLELSGEQRMACLMSTMRYQRMAKRYEELEAGKYKMQVERKADISMELCRAAEKQKKLLETLVALQAQQPQLTQDLQRVMQYQCVSA